MTYRTLIVTFLLAGLLGSLAAFYAAPTLSAYDLNLRGYQLDLVMDGQNPGLLYQVNTPKGAIVDIPFTAGGGMVINTLASLLGTTLTLTLLPYIGSFLISGTLGMIALSALRLHQSMTGPGGTTVAIVSGGLTGALGLMMGLVNIEVVGISLIGASFLLMSGFFLVWARGSTLLAGLCSLMGLWILPQAWPLVAALGAVSLMFLHRLPRRQYAMPSMIFTSLAAGALALSMGGASDLFSTDGISLAYPAGFAIMGLLVMVSGFLPLRRHGWILGLLGLGLAAFSTDVPGPVRTALIVMGLAGLIIWIWTTRQTATRGLKGREAALGFVTLGGLVALALSQTNSTDALLSPLGLALGWFVLMGGMVGTLRGIGYLGFDTAGGWAALGVALLPITAGLGGATGTILAQTPTTKTALIIEDRPQCDTTSLDMVYGQAEDLAIRRVFASALNGAHFLDNRDLSIVSLHPEIDGWEDAQTAWSDETESFTSARQTLFRRSIDTVLICGLDETLAATSFHNALWAGAAPEWLTLVDATDDYMLYQMTQEDAPQADTLEDDEEDRDEADSVTP